MYSYRTHLEQLDSSYLKSQSIPLKKFDKKYQDSADYVVIFVFATY